MRYEGEYEQAAYVYALSMVEGVGPNLILRIVDHFPDASALLGASIQDISRVRDQRLQLAMARARESLEMHLKRAREEIAKHLEKGIIPISIQSPSYPSLLRLIKDPPPILWVRGNIGVLQTGNTIAVIGTRKPTRKGFQTGYRVAFRFAQFGYTIVSGLAEGIDTAAHIGALDAGGVTVAVFGTPLDQVYPRQNRRLAERIVESGGTLISEYAIGTRPHRSFFVKRDRIQSGLSLAVIPVQTDVTGGTMHTVRFAREQGRLVLCPRPILEEEQERAYAGIHMLINSGVAVPFQGDEYEQILERLKEQHRLLMERTRLTSQRLPDERVALPGSPPVPTTHGTFLDPMGQCDLSAQVHKFLTLCQELGLDQNRFVFEAVVDQVRRLLFAAGNGERGTAR